MTWDMVVIATAAIEIAIVLAYYTLPLFERWRR